MSCCEFAKLFAIDGHAFAEQFTECLFAVELCEQGNVGCAAADKKLLAVYLDNGDKALFAERNSCAYVQALASGAA